MVYFQNPSDRSMAKEEVTSLQWVVGKLRDLRIERGLRLQDMATRLDRGSLPDFRYRVGSLRLKVDDALEDA